ncbi:hypothetical protein NDU88_002847 [Pleurodeles waltl]|uniref:Uncharacterized protein n=1 Tax=Pleurodeles waltl TaxID=8319 RepID=A0AAV7T3W4_PLEWA|nr:hypothetical protein NDU88_002847 [Pleurodeles waltl]
MPRGPHGRRAWAGPKSYVAGEAVVVQISESWPGVVRELTHETRAAECGPSSMLDYLLTSRPIRIKDGRDVGGGARGRISGAGEMRLAVLAAAPRGPYCLMAGK